MTVGDYSRLFWAGAVLVGVVVPLVLVAIFLAGGPLIALGLASGLALIGLLAYEHAWVQSGQVVPLS